MTKHKRSFLLPVCWLLTLSVAAQEPLWTEVSPTTVKTDSRQRNVTPLPGKFRVLRLNADRARQLQQQAPMELLSKRSTPNAVPFAIPLPDGRMQSDAIVESPLLSASLQASHPQLRTYQLLDASGRRKTGRLTITPEGITGLVFTDSGTVYISPLPDGRTGTHIVYYTRDAVLEAPLTCNVHDLVNGVITQGAQPLAGDCQLRTYRLGVAATAEYVSWAGGQANAITYITTTVNNVTAIYERDATIRFILVTNNNVLFTNAGTDPFDAATLDINTLTGNHNALNSGLGSGSYDLGIVFHKGWNGGLAMTPSACDNDTKGMAGAGLDFGTGANPVQGPQGPIFEGTVAHELAHQFSATHTFAATNGSCAGNATAATAYEPGGGSTLMAYAGVCTGNAYQNYTDLYFHGGSLAQIQSYVTGSGGSCATVSSLANTAPVLTPPATSYSIPVSTPFRLHVDATDAESDGLLYCWEQLDAAGTTTSPPSPTSTGGPNFRSFLPTGNPERLFPRMQSLLAGSSAYEVLPSVARDMHFQVTVRDGSAGVGCTSEAGTTVSTVAGTGPFAVTSQSTATTWMANGSNTATITWNVANSNAAPVNCTQVNILLSTDSGRSFPYVLAANTPNDGTEAIVIPSLPTPFARVMVQAANNIFFNINSSFITITSSCTAEGSSFSGSGDVAANAGDAALDLSLSPVYGSLVTTAGSVTGILEATDPDGFLALFNTSTSSCNGFLNTYRYDSYPFMVTVAGNYTFAKSAATNGAAIYAVYTGDYNPANPCQNLLGTSGRYDGTEASAVAGFTVSLSPGIRYTLTVGSFDEGTPPLPHSYSIGVTPPGGGQLYSTTPPPGAGFSYTYVIVENTTGNISAIDASADLSNTATFPGGLYTVYGLSYSNSMAPATLNSYIGGAFSALQNDIQYDPGAFCGNLSDNSIQVNVLSGLPVHFLPLNAYPQSNNTVLLKWGTGYEANSSHFEVLRSFDGINFTESIGTVQAAGNSSAVLYYQFTDIAPAQGWNYYRIRQVDENGQQSQLSNIARTSMEGAPQTATLRPNPVRSETTLILRSSVRTTVQLLITDSKGVVVMRSSLSAQPGLNSYPLSVARLAKGIYIVQLITDSGVITKRMMKE